MPPATLEAKIASISPRHRGELAAFVDFIIYKQSSELAEPSQAETRPRKSLFGAMRDGAFFMSPDFDAPLEDFAEYM